MSTLFTGGALGADKKFAECAHKAGHLVYNLSFEDHKISNKLGFIVQYTDEDLVIARPYLELANQLLKRRVPPNDTYVYRLLARNYYQIKDSEEVFAVAPIKDNQILGGTAWAIEMAKQQQIPINVFDLFENIWVKWNQIRGWQNIGQYPLFDRPFYEKYTGIGSRNLTKEGEQAIVDLYK